MTNIIKKQTYIGGGGQITGKRGTNRKRGTKTPREEDTKQKHQLKVGNYREA